MTATPTPLRAEVEWVANDIAKWFGDGIKPDEWKLHEWNTRLVAALSARGEAGAVAWYAEKTGRSNWSGKIETKRGVSIDYPQAAADEGFTIRPLIFGGATQPAASGDDISKLVAEMRDATTYANGEPGMPSVLGSTVRHWADRLAAVAPAGMDGWQPIETAPKDGTRVALLFDGGHEREGTWRTTYGGEWHVDSFTHLPWSGTPTHWHPIAAPTPPATAGKE